jgi:hypothetical protein
VVVERARLRRWAAGALAELRAGVDAACTARARAELGELAPVVERAVTVRLAVLDAEADR